MTDTIDRAGLTHDMTTTIIKLTDATDILSAWFELSPSMLAQVPAASLSVIANRAFELAEMIFAELAKRDKAGQIVEDVEGVIDAADKRSKLIKAVAAQRLRDRLIGKPVDPSPQTGMYL